MSFDDNKVRQSISLVIPCDVHDLDGMEWVIRSANYQTYLPFEVIVAVSGCGWPDVRDYEALWTDLLNPDIDLLVMVNEATLAAGTNRQLGAREASGDLISWFDADDLQLPDRLSLIEEAFLDSEILVVYHRFLSNIDRPYPPHDRHAFLYDDAIRMYHRGWVSVRKDVVTRVPWTERKRAQDFVYQRSVRDELGAEAIALLPEFLGVYFQYDFRDTSYNERKLHQLAKCYGVILNDDIGDLLISALID